MTTFAMQTQAADTQTAKRSPSSLWSVNGFILSALGEARGSARGAISAMYPS
jgi:hypothetical protein